MAGSCGSRVSVVGNRIQLFAEEDQERGGGGATGGAGGVGAGAGCGAGGVVEEAQHLLSFRKMDSARLPSISPLRSWKSVPVDPEESLRILEEFFGAKGHSKISLTKWNCWNWKFDLLDVDIYEAIGWPTGNTNPDATIATSASISNRSGCCSSVDTRPEYGAFTSWTRKPECLRPEGIKRLVCGTCRVKYVLISLIFFWALSGSFFGIFDTFFEIPSILLQFLEGFRGFLLNSIRILFIGFWFYCWHIVYDEVDRRECLNHQSKAMAFIARSNQIIS